MTEKRFTLSKIACYRTRLIKDKGVKLGNTDVCDLLNQLSEENEQLKKQINELEKQLNLKITERTFALGQELKRGDVE